jgi:tetratricopeptide (TPR) repeat protein
MRASMLSLSVALASAAAVFSLWPRAASADVELPRAVPAAKVMQQVGLTEISIEYDCPAASGRKIWGGVVPYDKVWMIGANPAAKLKLSRDVTFGDRVVPPGSYWLLAIPSKGAFTILVNKSPDPIASARDYKPELDVARLKVTPRTAPRRERLLFSFSDITDDRASLDLEWDGLRVPIPIQVNTTQQVLSSINGLDGTWRSFANAARYMLETKRDYDAGLKYVDQALALKEDWYAMWVKGALLAAKGDYAAATDWAERAHDLAQKVGNGAYLEPDLSKAIAEWSRKAPHRLDKETRPTAKLGAVAPPDAARDHDSVEQATSPPAFKAAADEAAAKPPAPLGDPPPMRRARLRHR